MRKDDGLFFVLLALAAFVITITMIVMICRAGYAEAGSLPLNRPPGCLMSIANERMVVI